LDLPKGTEIPPQRQTDSKHERFWCKEQPLGRTTLATGAQSAIQTGLFFNQENFSYRFAKPHSLKIIGCVALVSACQRTPFPLARQEA
jgi:hypothetical protein